MNGTPHHHGAGKGSRMKASADVPEWVLEEAASRPKA